MCNYFYVFTLLVVFSLAKAQQQQGCTECPTGCKNGTYLLRNRDQTCNCVCAEDLCNGIVCPPDFTCSQSKQCVPNKQGACPVQELTYLPKSTCLKDIDCKADLKCCPFNNNTYCSKPCPVMMCKCMAGFTVEYVLNEKGCPVCKCTPLSQASKSVNEVCTQPRKQGLCKAKLSRYFYNSETRKCELFDYGGCMGNENNFQTEEECESKCVTQKRSVSVNKADDLSFCLLKSELGPCKGMLTRYFFNPETNTCESFFYGGCMGNKNNFIEKNDCLKTCGTAAAPKTAQVSANACSQEKVVGDCRGSFVRYYFNKEANECQEFIYGGCNGNQNNFEGIEECQKTCSNQIKKKIVLDANVQCSLNPVSGPCYAYFENFFYNSTSKQCEKFVYGGCLGNENRFETEELCNQRCALSKPVQDQSICLLEKRTGMCRGHMKRYFYNDATKSCESFIYGGCNGNENNFLSLAECQQRCSQSPSVQNKLVSEVSVNACEQDKQVGNCRGHVDRFFFNRTANECQLFIYGGCNGNQNNFETNSECEAKCSAQINSKTTNQKSFCSLRYETGPCYAMIPRYYYDPQTKTCEEFSYGGCMGNKNNFVDKEQCLKACREPSVKSINTDVCSLEKQTGFCRGYNERYFYNSQTNECQQFIYGGCGGNENNFETLENCNKVCQKQAVSRSFPNPCELPGAVTGPCRGRIDRFFFNSKTKKCEQFNYGGCMGNENNFETVDQCNAQCLLN